MAGQFAHILLANEACTKVLDANPDLLPRIRSALVNYQPFCRLGAVSPDCASMIGDIGKGATGWSGVMHYVRPADFVRYAIPKVLNMPFGSADTRACIAWLFGYTAHLVADYTIHPVVEKHKLVGSYSIKANRPAHRRCEMNQDVYIFNKLTGGDVVSTNFLKWSGFAACGVKGNTNKLNPAIIDLWEYCLLQYPRSQTKPYVRLPKPTLNPINWFATYVNVMSKSTTKIASFFGMAYQPVNKVEKCYINNLVVPNSTTPIQYDALYAKALENIVEVWIQLVAVLTKNDPNLFTLRNADLDTGRDSTNGNYIYWS